MNYMNTEIHSKHKLLSVNTDLEQTLQHPWH